MRAQRRRIAIRFLLSVLVALAMPVVAAGLVEGVSVTAVTVAEVAQPSTDGSFAVVSGRVATRLSIPIGNGDLAYRNVGRSAPLPPKSH